MLAELVRTSIVDEALEQSGYRPKGPTASIITACDRLTWYRATGRLESQGLPDASSLEHMDDGHWHQTKFVERLRKTKDVKVLAEEFYVSCGKVRSRIDVRVSIKDRPYNVEFKSMSPNLFGIFTQEGAIAIPHYWAQCQVGIGGDPEIPFLLYGKSILSGKHWDELIEPDWDFIEEVKQRGEDFDRYKKLDEPPPRPYNLSSPQCSGCPARIVCWFPILRDRVLGRIHIKEDEAEKVAMLLARLDGLVGKVTQYNQFYGALRDYMELLHSRYGYRRIRLKGVNSLMFQVRRVAIDRDYVKMVLTPEQQACAFFPEVTENTRIKVHWEDI